MEKLIDLQKRLSPHQLKKMLHEEKKTVLFCPLDWGLGHIARDLPLIREFSRNGHRVIVAASEKLRQWLHAEEPGIETVFFEGPEVHYSGKQGAFLKVLLQLPGLLQWPAKEKKRIKELVSIYHPQLIISDNRYGARHQKVFSVLITHQLCIKLPKCLKWGEYPLYLLVKQSIKRFDQCWVPDFPKNNSLAGDLVHKYPLPSNALLTGPLSRFDGISADHNNIKSKKAVLGILSGPEPQRSLFENLLTQVLKKHPGQHTLLTGKTPSDMSSNETSGPVLLNHQPTSEMARLIREHRLIISRSGYSTIMDMYFLKKNILIVPTPGQPEQEYLATHHDQKNHKKILQSQIPETDFSKTTPPDAIRPMEKSPLNFRSVLNTYLQKAEKQKKI
ncbi:glycosyltransferase [Marinilabilia sp.]|uniref:glycosyltransferase n=1 Tax=Marinilabilia sp. TaxID=2021252 RepID=UPI0025BCDEA0|nr:glycosyltransferase [Marinilabilia sp.]